MSEDGCLHLVTVVNVYSYSEVNFLEGKTHGTCGLAMLPM